MVGKICQSNINVLTKESHEFFNLIYKLLFTFKVSNEDKIKLNLIEHEGKRWQLSFQKQNQTIMNTWKFQEEIDIQLYSLYGELNVIKNRLYEIRDKYNIYA